jgi:peptidoglycan hydrolase-like protein with peptidoglycan-binding domain
MRSQRISLWLLLSAWVACGHTHEATDKPERGPSQAKPSSAERPHKVDRTSGGDSKRSAVPPSDAAVPPLASSPAGLLREDAVPRIQEQLKAKGYLQHQGASGKLDGETEAALRAFQRDRHLPATGMPDDETVQQLGLSAGDIFRGSRPANP